MNVRGTGAALRATAVLLLTGCAGQQTFRAPVVTGQPIATTAQPAVGFSCPKRGLALTTTTGGGTIFYGNDPADPEVCLVQHGGMTSPGRRLFMMEAAGSRNAEPFRAAMRALLPFRPGMSATYDSFGAESYSQWKNTIRTIGIERITVPAGTFEAYVFDFEQEGIGGNYYKGSARWWFDTRTWLPVKFVPTHMAGVNSGLAAWEARQIGVAPI